MSCNDHRKHVSRAVEDLLDKETHLYEYMKGLMEIHYDGPQEVDMMPHMSSDTTGFIYRAHLRKFWAEVFRSAADRLDFESMPSEEEVES